MSKHYKHLSEEERDRLAILKGQDLPMRAIAAQLGRSPSTISRELRRNASSGRSSGYLPHKAQTEADEARASVYPGTKDHICTSVHGGIRSHADLSTRPHQSSKGL